MQSAGQRGTSDRDPCTVCNALICCAAQIIEGPKYWRQRRNKGSAQQCARLGEIVGGAVMSAPCAKIINNRQNQEACRREIFLEKFRGVCVNLRIGVGTATILKSHFSGRKLEKSVILLQ